MELSKKQQIFKNFMLERIGFSNEEIENYWHNLASVYGKMKPFFDPTFYNNERWDFSLEDCLSILISEINIKKYNNIRRKALKKSISATDIANFNFCKASFSITNSFQIDKLVGKERMEFGETFHEELKAIKKIWINKRRENIYIINQDLSNIKKSKVIFLGHKKDKNKKQFFYNNNWVGEPDYIMLDSENNHFVIEEKFKYKYDPSKKNGSLGYDRDYGEIWDDDKERQAREEEEIWKKSKGYFFSNNIIQVLSYINNIKDFPIKYGILIYWYYDFDKRRVPYIHKVITKKIQFDTQSENLYNSNFSELQKFLTNNEIPFDSEKVNFKKCANCSVSLYCGHKTKKFNTIKFPYDFEHTKLIKVEFPEELKKNDR